MDRRTFIRTAGAAIASPTMLNPTINIEQIPSENVPTTEERNLTSTPSTAVLVLNKMGYGPRPGDTDTFNSLGSTDSQRLAAYIEEQLDPGSIDDSECDARIAAAGFTTLEKSQADLWRDHRRSSDWWTRMLPLYELEKAQIIRAVYSKRQLNEFLVDFWQNHFNIYAHESYAAAPYVVFDRDIIRANQFGNFRTMLGLTARSSVMLRYLDNYINSVDGPNENYARELFELHTLGAENYLGVIAQEDVPLDENGVPTGYVDQDVYEATRALTGWSYSYATWYGDDDSGAFLYRADWHDRFQKFVLGEKLSPDQAAMKDGEDVLDLVAYHPGTGRYICRKLCRRLISDDPPESVVQGAAAIFYAAREDADQLAQVYRYILQSDAFSTTWGEKVKRPFEFAMSFFRAVDIDLTFRNDHSATSRFTSYYNNAGQRLYYWGPPNGYPDEMEAWNTTGNRVFLWRMINEMIAYRADDEDDPNVITTDIRGNYHIDVLGQTPSNVRTATALADYWIDRILYRALNNTNDRADVIDFMANGFNNSLDLPLDDERDVQDRLR
ncbi:MAG: DUF1800 domain-containing protein, partial [Chloroflexota bacterium]